MTAAALAIVILAAALAFALAWRIADKLAARREKAYWRSTVAFLSLEIDDRDKVIRNLQAKWSR